LPRCDFHNRRKRKPVKIDEKVAISTKKCRAFSSVKVDKTQLFGTNVVVKYLIDAVDAESWVNIGGQ
jgi:hypothetical protein